MREKNALHKVNKTDLGKQRAAHNNNAISCDNLLANGAI